MKFTHFNDQARAHMVDVSDKDITIRVAKAQAMIELKKETLEYILTNKIKKGDVFAVAQVAGIQAAKQTHLLIPMCHPLLLSHVDLTFLPDEENSTIQIISTVKMKGNTGVEMEALTTVTIAALTIYDMCKAIDKGMVIKDIHLVKKSGGRSGDFYFSPNKKEEGTHVKSNRD